MDGIESEGVFFLPIPWAGEVAKQYYVLHVQNSLAALKVSVVRHMLINQQRVRSASHDDSSKVVLKKKSEHSA